MGYDYELHSARLRQLALRGGEPYSKPEATPKPKPAPKPKPPKPDLWWIAQKIMGEVGNCVPDGDPIDFLGPAVVRKYGIDRWDVTKLLDKACRKHLGVRNYNQYLIDAWDGYNECCDPKDRVEPNPWKESKG